MITLGTGIGGGIVVDGKIVDGAHGAAGELGHLSVIKDNGHLCNCGKHGCLETVASATGIENLFNDLAPIGKSNWDTPIQHNQGNYSITTLKDGRQELIVNVVSTWFGSLLI